MDGRSITIVDILDEDAFALLPPCIDPRFDHRSCDYWEDEVRGSKAARARWWQAPAGSPPGHRPAGPSVSDNPFAPPPTREDNPFAPPRGVAAANPFAADRDQERATNPFAPAPEPDPGVDLDSPRKLRLLGRGRRVFGSYAKVLLVGDEPAAYTQFGPLSAYPRAQRMRELYPRLPSAPLPAVITCIASRAGSQGRGLARALVLAVCEDLSARGFAAVETFPDLTLGPAEASAATSAFWEACGFRVAMGDDRFPVMRRELD